MRFDLELDLVSSCNCQDLKYLSSILYDTSDKTILPSLYDKKTLFYKEIINTGKINTDKYLNFKEVSPNLFQSYIKDDNINLLDIIDNNSLLYPIFKGGSFYSGNKEFSFSSLYIIDKINYTNRYEKELEDTVDVDTVSIYTLSLIYPGIINKSKEFVFKEYTESLENTFKNSSEDYIYTLLDNKIYLNIDEIIHTNIKIGKSNGISRMYVLPEFPVSTVSINGYLETDYKILNGLLIFNKDKVPALNEDIVISCSITPVITYKKLGEEREDILSTASNISPNSVGFKNGVVCLYNSYQNSDLPATLELKIETINKLTNTFRVIGKLLSTSGMPVKNKEITFSILTQGAKFVETNSSTYKAITNMAGEATAILFENEANNGIYIQKEWVSGSDLYIPKEVEINDLNSTFLYVITADDPILGKFKAFTGEKFIEENYLTPSINSYYVSGRKIAFIELLNKDGKLVQKYIKPTLVETEENKSMTFRNLFLQGKEETIKSYEQNATFNSTLAIEAGTYENGSIPYNKIDLYNKVIPKVTKLSFTKAIPAAENIVGYMLIFNRKVDIVATYVDEYMSIASETVSIEVKNIKSESPFILSGINLEDKNTTLHDLGYYTVSDYIQNDYNLYPCTYGCIYSDVISKTCIHKDEKYHSFYNTDGNDLMCIHTPEYDLTIDESLRCNGIKAQMINPFNLLVIGAQ